MSVFVKFWGTRGSIPTPGSWTRVYGGNTSCVELRFEETVLICDAGSGLRELGRDLMNRSPRPTEFHLFLTHSHWDHIQGFPFFTPAYLPFNRIRVYGTTAGDERNYQLLSGQMTSHYFPVAFGDLGARVLSDHLENGEKLIDGVRVKSFPLHHPGGCSGFSFEKGSLKIVYATDNELLIGPDDTFPDPNHEGKIRSAPPGLVEAARGADLLITDSQFSEEQYSKKKGWGHSSCYSATDLAVQAGVKNLALFHHDPENSDRDVEAMVKACRQRAEKWKSDTTIFAAREGVELRF